MKSLEYYRAKLKELKKQQTITTDVESRLLYARERLSLVTKGLNDGHKLEDLSPSLNRLSNMARTNIKFDEDYYSKCLSCGRVVLAGPKCCSGYKTQAMLDKEN